jgi:CII-binding regulator of phage lambda lysogenization HflD
MSKTIKLNQMENKITKEELTSLKELQGKLNQSVSQVGFLETQKHSLLHAIAEINSDVEKQKSELEAKYGSISINLEDGSFEEVKQEEASAE